MTKGKGILGERKAGLVELVDSVERDLDMVDYRGRRLLGWLQN
jgi:hypothetical protein